MYYENCRGGKNQTHINPFLQNFRMALSRKTEIYEIKIQCRKLNVSKVFRCFLGLCAVRASGFGRAAVQQRSWNAESTAQFNWMLSHRLEFCWKFKLVFEFRCFLQFDLIFSSSDLLRFFFLFFFFKKKIRLCFIDLLSRNILGS